VGGQKRADFKTSEVRRGGQNSRLKLWGRSARRLRRGKTGCCAKKEWEREKGEGWNLYNIISQQRNIERGAGRGRKLGRGHSPNSRGVGSTPHPRFGEMHLIRD